jgi:hypothetical protein
MPSGANLTARQLKAFCKLSQNGFAASKLISNDRAAEERG